MRLKTEFSYIDNVPRSLSVDEVMIISTYKWKDGHEDNHSTEN